MLASNSEEAPKYHLLDFHDQERTSCFHRKKRIVGTWLAQKKRRVIGSAYRELESALSKFGVQVYYDVRRNDHGEHNKPKAQRSGKQYG
jgi:hypothetical protein